MKIEDVDVSAEPNSGTKGNVIDKHQFKALTNRSNVKLTLQPSRVELNTLQSELPVKRELTATVRIQTCGAVARFVVTRGRINSHPHQQKYPSRAGYVTDQRIWLFRRDQ